MITAPLGVLQPRLVKISHFNHMITISNVIIKRFYCFLYLKSERKMLCHVSVGDMCGARRGIGTAATRGGEAAVKHVKRKMTVCF